MLGRYSSPSLTRETIAYATPIAAIHLVLLPSCSLLSSLLGGFHPPQPIPKVAARGLRSPPLLAPRLVFIVAHCTLLGVGPASSAWLSRALRFRGQ